MGALAAGDIDAWLRQGGLVVAASERAARALRLRFHRARRQDGLKAWPSPNILDWMSFVRAAWEERFRDDWLVLNRSQEQSIWAEIVEADGSHAGLLEGPRYRLAAMAMDAHELLCSHAPRYLRAGTRSGWQNDTGAFSRWLATFDDRCRAEHLISPSRLPLELLGRLLDSPRGTNGTDRPALLLTAFDRLLPVQHSLFEAWGAWREAAIPEATERVDFYEATDDQSELSACALWCGRKLSADPGSRIVVVTQNAGDRRGEIERAFLRATGSAASPLFEFSLGTPLSLVALARAALLLLRWLTSSLAEHEMDWLFSTGYAASDRREGGALQARMRALRRRNLQRPAWSLDAWLASFKGEREEDRASVSWVVRIRELRERIFELARSPRTALEWSEIVPQWLEALHFGEAEPLSSAEFQAFRRWSQALETAGSLGFNGRRILLREFLSLLSRALEQTLFALESHDAAIQIAGPAESAGLDADAVWFLGATEIAWPAGGTTHPLLPVEVQREAQMPHATRQLDWDLAQAISRRLVASAPEAHFSYAQQVAGVEARPSRLAEHLAGAPRPLPPDLAAPSAASPMTVCIVDDSLIPLTAVKVKGGANVLTLQSQCPFKAFATSRLGAESWEPAQAGLTAAQRGQLLHAVLHRIWAGPPEGIRSLAELQLLEGRERFIAERVRNVFQTELTPGLRDRMPERYLEIEKDRLTRLITEWLQYESTRVSFDVLETEASRTIVLAGLSFDLRLDRIDKLNDGTVLVIDYKTGDLKPKVWELPRPEDVQLPLYAGFAVGEQELLGGLVFAKVRPVKLEFSGHVGAASATLWNDLNKRHALLKNPLSAEQLDAWRRYIEQLARDFLGGRADVDPRDPPKTCERCGLQTLCRIHESQRAMSADEMEDGVSGFGEAADE